MSITIDPVTGKKKLFPAMTYFDVAGGVYLRNDGTWLFADEMDTISEIDHRVMRLEDENASLRAILG